jgi:hypothetical protein
MIDEFTELGDYDFQIRLLNNDLSSRATLPPVSAGIRVMEPLCEESVNTAPVNYSRAVIDREIEGTFDEEGNYNKTDWSNGDIITDSKLNKIEDALYTINDNNGDYATKDDIPTDVSAFTNDAGYINDISHLAAKDELPTNVSELTNDAGYLTEHQSLEAYALKADIPSTDGLATEQYVNDAVNNIEIPEPDLSDYATKDDLANIEIPEVDLSGYVTKGNCIYRCDLYGKLTLGEIRSLLMIHIHYGGLYYGELNFTATDETGTEIRIRSGDLEIYETLYHIEYVGMGDSYLDLYEYRTMIKYRFALESQYLSQLPKLLSKTKIGLEDYATKDELQTALGDIESLLGGI